MNDTIKNSLNVNKEYIPDFSDIQKDIQELSKDIENNNTSQEDINKKLLFISNNINRLEEFGELASKEKQELTEQIAQIEKKFWKEIQGSLKTLQQHIDNENKQGLDNLFWSNLNQIPETLQDRDPKIATNIMESWKSASKIVEEMKHRKWPIGAIARRVSEEWTENLSA